MCCSYGTDNKVIRNVKQNGGPPVISAVYQASQQIPSQSKILSALIVKLVLVDRPNSAFHVLNAYKELVQTQVVSHSVLYTAQPHIKPFLLR